MKTNELSDPITRREFHNFEDTPAKKATTFNKKLQYIKNFQTSFTWLLNVDLTLKYYILMEY